ncbi:serine (or cysteine) peptidase inhibitor, clade A (alpha-1 antiproteinase, antitrypsin), member 10, isoform CRA_a [Rattus norvegicus]|uniref:Serine (Or cysteine) peptidase inhibitor, clade A (Alpha-1 antiproteinase, antitrypsin), member 10, isoform CRA_a n=1 Tax=Rattus norvegicus TaxID=10116 RepID=A6JEN7_RAT|nr:serine (or cysteine) peptidase inhibitor, clade A (alpha-1 antiproteinase, antitrypsin), member 10, isoform CRA_a [Rattus norvegicus]
MRVVSSLFLPVLLAEVWLVSSFNLSSHSPEAPIRLVSQDYENQTWEEYEWADPRDDNEYWLRASQQLSNETSSFGFSLLRKISMRHDGNVIFSPFGLSVAMVNLMLGAKGETKVQVENGLNLQALSQAGPLILPALFKRVKETFSSNKKLGLTQGSFAFIHKDFEIKKTYFNLSTMYFDTEYVPTNFRNSSQARGLMNHYINKETEGKIPKLFDEINPETKLILVDYILFKGNATMLVVLMEKSGDHLALEDYLTTDLVEMWLQDMKTRKMEVFFPKFKLNQRYEMHELLKQVGIRRIFSTSADLSELSAVARNLQVSKVVQQSVLEVDERGTEVVSGTVSEITAYCMPPVIKVDRPFHFIIYEEMSQMLLFLGRVVNPTVL